MQENVSEWSSWNDSGIWYEGLGDGGSAAFVGTQDIDVTQQVYAMIE